MQLKNVPYGSKFYTGRDGNVYTRLRENNTLKLHLETFLIWVIDDSFYLHGLSPMTEVTLMPATNYPSSQRDMDIINDR